jgi:hypothetical protein
MAQGKNVLALGKCFLHGYLANTGETHMPHNDDTDRFCPVCHGRRFLTDTHTSDYSYSAHTLTPCWSCHVPSAAVTAPYIGPDDLMDAAVARLAAAAGLGAAEFRARMFEVAA